MSRVLLIIAQSGFQDHELKGTRQGLLDAGCDVSLASTEKGVCTGKYGSTEQASVALRDVNVADYDSVAFIGGPGAGALTENADALRIARETVAASKPLGAICIAPTILAAAGVLKGKNATVWDDGNETQIQQVENAGATYTGDLVTVDGLIITGNGPVAAEEFGKIFAAVVTSG